MRIFPWFIAQSVRKADVRTEYWSFREIGWVAHDSRADAVS